MVKPNFEVPRQDVVIQAIVYGNKTNNNATSIFVKNMAQYPVMKTLAVLTGNASNPAYAINITPGSMKVCYVDIPYRIPAGEVKLFPGHIANRFRGKNFSLAEF